MAAGLCYRSHGGGARPAFHHQVDTYHTDSLIELLQVDDHVITHRTGASARRSRVGIGWRVGLPLPIASCRRSSASTAESDLAVQIIEQGSQLLPEGGIVYLSAQLLLHDRVVGIGLQPLHRHTGVSGSRRSL